MLKGGFERLTTTKVANRAGVSVGTLYQYFPNKRALLVAVLERHLDGIATAIEAACVSRHGCTVREMMAGTCNAFVDAKMRRLDVSLALYPLAAKLGDDAVVRTASARAQAALMAMLITASDASFEDVSMPSLIVISATIGPVQAIMELGASPPMLETLRLHLVDLCVGYLDRVKRVG